MALALIFCDSFDHYNSLALKWDGVGVDNSIDLTGTKSRTGTGALSINSSASGPFKNFTAQSKLLTMDAFNPNGNAPIGTKANILWFIDSGSGTQQVRIVYNPDLSIAVLTGNDPFPVTLATSAPGVLQASSYNFIMTKVTISAVAGTVLVRVNGAIVINITGVNTDPAASGTANRVQLYMLGGLALGFHDDFAVFSWSVAGDDLTSAPGIYCAVPSSDSTPLQWVPSSGSAHFSLVNTIPQQTANFVSSNAIGNQDQYIHTIPSNENVPPLPPNVSIISAQHCLYAETDIAGPRSIASDIGGNVGASLVLTVTPKIFTTPWDTNPVTTLPWAKADLATTKIGEEVTA
jgi:hypothetical protein